jgi:hypothetical protein
MGVRSRAKAAVVIVGVGVMGALASAPAHGQGGMSLDVHGFVSQGALLSTGNDYLARSQRGSVEFFEAGINVSTEVVDKLRVGLQLFTRDLGPIGDYNIALDWAYLDYRFREWLGLRAGRIKLPFGLYNEYSDVDSARLWVLLPQAMYPTRSRDLLLAQTGFSLYGSGPLGPVGALDYQLSFGTINWESSDNPAITNIDSQYVAAGQVFYRPPVPGLRLGGSALFIGVDIDFKFSPAESEMLRMRGVVGPDFMGDLKYELQNLHLLVASLEYAAHGWLIAAEYGRWLGQAKVTPPLPGFANDMNDERFYGMVAYRLTSWFEAGGYYAVHFPDADDRGGANLTRFRTAHRAFQRDLSLSLRFDINEHWLFKLEGHYMVGTADLNSDEISRSGGYADLDRSWTIFLAKTTLSF